MRLGIPGLDKGIGEIREGDVFLIESVGSLGIELLSTIISENKEGSEISIILPKGASEKRILSTKNTETMILGEDVHPERLYELLHHVRALTKGSILIAVRLDVLLFLRPKEAVYMFMEDLASIVQKNKIILIVTIDKRNLEESDMALFENLATHIIDIGERVKDFNVSFLMRVKKSPKGSTGFCEFEIIHGRIVIHDPRNAA